MGEQNQADLTAPTIVKAKLAGTKDAISVVATAVPVLGLVGTVFVWLTANLYVGSLEIQPNIGYKVIAVHVYDKKGQESIYTTPRFQLMPGQYHIAVSVDDKPPHQLDTQIELNKTAVLKVDESAPSQPDPPTYEAHKHWWQFWKKSHDSKSKDDE